MTLSVILACWLPPAVWAQSKKKGKTSSAAKRRVVKIPREAVNAIEGFELAKDIKANLFAAEPLIGNPVAIDVDEQGRVFVCESYRQEKGVEDNRQHVDWVDDDLASQTVDDRLSLLKKHLQGDLKSFTANQDRIRLLIDRNDDGRADRSTVFADGFNGPLDGTGAGVLARKGNVFYTCIPSLYAFRDANGDGKADKKIVMLTGFGVKTAHRGHDLHGLNIGPDGRLYFSIGDRGMNVKTKRGPVRNVESGSILRCELDGRNLEMVASGFRNPQDLAFDDLGNLFTCDNNSDSGDRARWIHVQEGADYGWRMAYQYLIDRGPFNREHIWEKDHPDRPAFHLPPIDNIADGPAGLAYYPGTGLTEAYNGNFFLCDFRGQASLSGVRSFKHQAKGASYEVIDPEVFLWNCLVTDIDFGTDGSIFVSDWVSGWTGTGKGRIYRLRHRQADKSKVIAETKKLLAAGMRKQSEANLRKLLSHIDRRVRMEAQFELAKRAEVELLSKVASESSFIFARLHATWGLGQIARSQHKKRDAAIADITTLLRHDDAETRVAAVNVLGEAGDQNSASRIEKRLFDQSIRVQVAACYALAKLGNQDQTASLIEAAAENANADPVLRHAIAMGLAHCGTPEQLKTATKHEDPAVRLAVVLALRMQESTVLGMCLDDSDESIVTEAARAIHDQPIPFLYPQLAQLLEGPVKNDSVLRRALNAHYHLGTAADAQALAKFATDSAHSMELRHFALHLLNEWESGSTRDQVLGMWRPIDPEHQGQDAVDALRSQLTPLMNSGQEIRVTTARMAAKFGIAEVADQLIDILWDTDRDGQERAGALLALSSLQADDLESLCRKAIKDDQPRVRAAGRIVLTEVNPTDAVDELIETIKHGTQLERQSAVSMLAKADREASDDALAKLMEMRTAGKIPEYLRLDVVHAAQSRAENSTPLKNELANFLESLDPDDPLSPYLDTLHGGSAERGERLFVERQSIGCVKCHRVGDQGGTVGPDLSKVGSQLTREQILTSIVFPNKDITKGFETAVITTVKGKVYSGVIRKMDKEKIIIVTPEEKLITIDTDEIDDVDRGTSAMPDDIIHYLTTFDLRDLMEYLAQLK